MLREAISTHLAGSEWRVEMWRCARDRAALTDTPTYYI